MPYETDDDVLRHLRRQEWPLTAWLFGSIQLDPRYFDTNPNFATALRHVEDIETITHFNHDDPILESADESEELTDTHYRLTIKHLRKFKRVRASSPFVVVSGQSGFLILTPIRYWSFLDENYSTGDTKDIGLERFCYEHKLTSPRPSDEVLQETWKYATKSGNRDMRYKDNISAALVQRYGVTLHLQNESKWELGGLLEEEQDQLFETFQAITDQEVGLGEQDNDEIEENEENDQPSKNDLEASETLWCEAFGLASGATYSEIEAAYQEKMKRLYLAREEGLELARQEHENGAKEHWYLVLSVSPDAITAEEINAAYKEKIKQYHPDRVSNLGEKLQILAKIEAQKLNAARDEGLAWTRRDDNDSESEENKQSFEYEAECTDVSGEAWYEVLAVLPDATSEEIEAAYYSTMEYLQDALRLAEMTQELSS